MIFACCVSSCFLCMVCIRGCCACFQNLRRVTSVMLLISYSMTVTYTHTNTNTNTTHRSTHIHRYIHTHTHMHKRTHTSMFCPIDLSSPIGTEEVVGVDDPATLDPRLKRHVEVLRVYRLFPRQITDQASMRKSISPPRTANI